MTVGYIIHKSALYPDLAGFVMT